MMNHPSTKARVTRYLKCVRRNGHPYSESRDVESLSFARAGACMWFTRIGAGTPRAGTFVTSVLPAFHLSTLSAICHSTPAAPPSPCGRLQVTLWRVSPNSGFSTAGIPTKIRTPSNSEHPNQLTKSNFILN